MYDHLMVKIVISVLLLLLLLLLLLIIMAGSEGWLVSVGWLSPPVPPTYSTLNSTEKKKTFFLPQTLRLSYRFSFQCTVVLYSSIRDTIILEFSFQPTEWCFLPVRDLVLQSEEKQCRVQSEAVQRQVTEALPTCRRLINARYHHSDPPKLKARQCPSPRTWTTLQLKFNLLYHSNAQKTISLSILSQSPMPK